jgi:tRNA (guanine-N7-)-methyltransferase
VEVLDRCIPDAALDRVLLFFPDPWPKRKHHKRRILQPAFVDRIARKLKTGGRFHMATDWEPYAGHMLKVMQSTTDFVNCDPAGGYSKSPGYRPVTRFERRGQRLGHGVRDLVYQRV